MEFLTLWRQEDGAHDTVEGDAHTIIRSCELVSNENCG